MSTRRHLVRVQRDAAVKKADCEIERLGARTTPNFGPPAVRLEAERLIVLAELLAELDQLPSLPSPSFP